MQRAGLGLGGRNGFRELNWRITKRAVSIRRHRELEKRKVKDISHCSSSREWRFEWSAKLSIGPSELSPSPSLKPAVSELKERGAVKQL